MRGNGRLWTLTRRRILLVRSLSCSTLHRERIALICTVVFQQIDVEQDVEAVQLKMYGVTEVSHDLNVHSTFAHHHLCLTGRK